MRVFMASQIHLFSILSSLRVHGEETGVLFVSESAPLVPLELVRLHSMSLVRLVSLIWIISCKCQIMMISISKTSLIMTPLNRLSLTKTPVLLIVVGGRYIVAADSLMRSFIMETWKLS